MTDDKCQCCNRSVQDAWKGTWQREIGQMPHEDKWACFFCVTVCYGNDDPCKRDDKETVKAFEEWENEERIDKSLCKD